MHNGLYIKNYRVGSCDLFWISGWAHGVFVLFLLPCNSPNGYIRVWKNGYYWETKP